MSARSKGPLTNQLGTGVIPPEEETRLLAQGTKFAAYWQPSCGDPILITSAYADIYARWAEQLTCSFEREFGVPARFPLQAAPIPG